MPSRMTRAIAIAASTAFLATSVDLRMATAGSAPSKAPGQHLGSATDMDFSARKKRRRGGGNAAAFAAIAGTIGAIAIAQAQRKRHRHYYYGAPAHGYYGGPVYSGYYHGGPVYYGGHHGRYVAPHAYRYGYGAPHRPKDYVSGPGWAVGGAYHYGTGQHQQAIPAPPSTYSSVGP